MHLTYIFQLCFSPLKHNRTDLGLDVDWNQSYLIDSGKERWYCHSPTIFFQYAFSPCVSFSFSKFMDEQISFIPPIVQGVTYCVCSGTTNVLSVDLICYDHQVGRAGVTSHVSSTASSFLQFLFLLSLFHSLPSPPNPFSPVPSHSLLLAFVSSSPSLSLASFPSDFFSYCSSSHTPSCCSKSLKGTELGLLLLPW